MSGGHWNYLQQRFDEAADIENQRRSLAVNSLELLGQIEHELDWGHCCDSCLGCARRRVLAALDTFFGDNGYPNHALAVLRDREQVANYCSPCLRGLPTWTRSDGAKPTEAEAARELVRRDQQGERL